MNKYYELFFENYQKDLKKLREYEKGLSKIDGLNREQSIEIQIVDIKKDVYILNNWPEIKSEDYGSRVKQIFRESLKIYKEDINNLIKKYEIQTPQLNQGENK